MGYIDEMIVTRGVKLKEGEIRVWIRAVGRISKSRIKSDLKKRIKSDLSDFLTGRKPLLLWSF